MDSNTPPTFWDQLTTSARALAGWLDEHQDGIQAFGTWGTVNKACRLARLYAPRDDAAWNEISDAVRARGSVNAADCEEIIISTNRPGGVGYDALRQELLDAPLLHERQREV